MMERRDRWRCRACGATFERLERAREHHRERLEAERKMHRIDYDPTWVVSYPEEDDR